jgi:hypothetical protein
MSRMLSSWAIENPTFSPVTCIVTAPRLTVAGPTCSRPVGSSEFHGCVPKLVIACLEFLWSKIQDRV